jgi:hypothetical protein
MTTQRIEVLVTADGEIKIEAHGYTGTDCVEATRALEQALGTPQGRRRKPEYNQQARNRAGVKR